jgi:hypothetical protein
MSNTMDEPLFVEEPLLIVEEPLLLTVGGSIPHPAPVDILDDDMEGAIVYYGLIPVGIDWTDSKSVQQYFQPIAGKTKTQVPKCLLMDAKTVLDKLKIVNFWRCLDSDGVKLWKGKFTQVYKRPSASNDRKAADQFARVQKAIESDLLAMEALREDAETEYVYVGLADRPAIQAAAAQATASKKRSKKNKRKRRTSTEPPTNSNQIYDRTAQNGWIRIEKGVGHHF